jgi:hypothetical protein
MHEYTLAFGRYQIVVGVCESGHSNFTRKEKQNETTSKLLDPCHSGPADGNAKGSFPNLWRRFGE